MTGWRKALGVCFALGLLLAACSSDDSGDGGSSADDGGGGAADDGGGGGGNCEGDVCLEGLAYDPAEVTVSAGDSVSWENIDGTDHTVTADDDSFDSGEFADGQSFEQTFDEAGDFAYHCEIHPSMTGTVTVE